MSRVRKRETRAQTLTTWRDRVVRGQDERQAFWAMRRKQSLTVTVSRVSPDRVVVLARMTGSVGAPEGESMQWAVDASNAPADAERINAAVAVAKRWAENQADQIAGVKS